MKKDRKRYEDQVLRVYMCVCVYELFMRGVIENIRCGDEKLKKKEEGFHESRPKKKRKLEIEPDLYETTRMV